MVSSLATASQEPVARAVTETSRPTVASRVSTRLQPLSAMRRVTASNGDRGCVAIGRASCRERVCQYVLISVVAGSFKKQNMYESPLTHIHILLQKYILSS